MFVCLDKSTDDAKIDLESTEFFIACQQKWSYINEEQQDAPDFLRDFLNHLHEELPKDITEIISDTFYCGIKTQLENMCDDGDCNSDTRRVVDDLNDSERQIEWTPTLAIHLPSSPKHANTSINLQDLILPEEEVYQKCNTCSLADVKHIKRNTFYHAPKVLVMMCIL